ncbi:hypothetical protein [Deinococcus budaensis]|uniref:Uncharacterized protein n=1 Tax=Deinococcus budaensis TaxID=1665626 RepID=A0A7W8LRX7_9DEIO|nr:hypothetical protein [Deinococcus budaensis]MBB5236105.1 hypothetical protein [Deinococcus budaensis]
MSDRDTERYLDRATRGLWGQARRDARLELRGAVEDKVYRFSLLGLDGPEAVQAALRDLGSPHAIARDLSRVHSLPHAARAALLAGVAGLLGVQALAQVPTVRAIAERQTEECRPLSPAARQTLTAQQRQTYDAFVQSKGGPEGAVAWCQQQVDQRSDLLSLKDIVVALEAGGVQVDMLDGVEGYLILSFPGGKNTQGLDLSHSLKQVGGQAYVSKLVLLGRLRQSVTKVPLRLEGLVNPVLQLGPAKLQLGTPSTPVLATDIYAFPVLEDLEYLLKEVAPHDLPVRFAVLPENKDYLGPVQALNLSAPDGTLYALVSNELLTLQQPLPNCVCDWFSLSVRRVQNERIQVPNRSGSTREFRIVSSPAELLTATQRKEAALLVYRLDPSDLRNLKLTPVPAGQVRLTPSRP